MKTQKQKASLAQIVQPLIDLLSRKYPIDAAYPYRVIPLRRRRKLPLDGSEVAIPLDNDMPLLAFRAVATLVNLGFPDDKFLGRRQERPLLFYFVKEAFGFGEGGIIGITKLMISCERELDVNAATQQIAQLTAHLEDPTNLLPLSRKRQARFF